MIKTIESQTGTKEHVVIIEDLKSDNYVKVACGHRLLDTEKLRSFYAIAEIYSPGLENIICFNCKNIIERGDAEPEKY